MVQHRWLILVAAGILLPELAIAAPARGDRCTLGEGVQLSARPKGKGKKRKIAPGTEVRVLAVVGRWVQIEAGMTAGWAEISRFERACGAAAESAEDAPSFEPAPTLEAEDSFAPEASSEPERFPTRSDDEPEGAYEREGSYEAGDSPETAEYTPAGVDPAAGNPMLTIGPGVAYGTYIEGVGMRADAFVPVYREIWAGLAFVFWFPKYGNAFTISADAHYVVDPLPSLHVFPLAGLVIAYGRIVANGIPHSNTEIGLNVGGGAELDLGGMRPYAEAKYSIINFFGSGSQLAFAGGIRLEF